ncbi:DNA-binding transcriptional LysR family regulator [Aminobacter aminovorans]|nr:DNA-binding transcriptional LysR family regulator [Aminobacter aminovorans]
MANALDHALIASFRAEYPEIRIILIARVAVLDPTEERVDVAIRYGNGNWPHLDSSFLFWREILPVGSPSYLTAFPVNSTEDLRLARLLDLDGPAASYSEWKWWFAVQCIEIGRLPELSFNNYPLLVPLPGQGAILAWGNVNDDLIASGALSILTVWAVTPRCPMSASIRLRSVPNWFSPYKPSWHESSLLAPASLFPSRSS